MTGPGRLVDEIKAWIAQSGPIGVDRYMALALGHPGFGYYQTRDPFGAGGDFITAPEISQMFGELIGLWAAAVWAGMGSPDPIALVELGPGRGTLMADALRASAAVPRFRQAVRVHLVETSRRLRDVQADTLSKTGVPIAWHADLDELPAGPLLIVANEFFDALPVRQYVRTARGWCERLVGIAGEGLAFGAAPDREGSIGVDAPPGALLEVGLAARGVAAAIGARLRCDGGAALVIDYGYAGARLGDSLQAVKAHAFVDPLAEPGEADLTAHVDFAALARVARTAGARVHGPVEQGAFLYGLGLRERAAALSRKATPGQADAIAAVVARLAGPDPGMGQLFKVMAVSHPDTPPLPGFFTEVRP